LKLNPSLCILHAEANEDLLPSFQTLKEAGIKVGVALLPPTFPGNVQQYIDAADHVLIFAGQLGVQGAPADLMQMEKIPLVRNMKPEVEIGWDGGANIDNVRFITHGGVDVINVGSGLAKAPNKQEMYEQLLKETENEAPI
jgi:ribulose-phosphate 3-epimerase